MLIFRWRVQFTSRRRKQPQEPRALFAEMGGVVEWLDREDIPDGTPFLVAPDGGFDESLNMYFLSYGMVMASPHTQEAAARDLARFLDFLWFHRPAMAAGRGAEVSRPRSWRDAVEADRRAFEWWRCRDEAGPLVAATTWDREVASVNGFYRWAVRRGHVAVSPIAQRRSRSRWSGAGRGGCEGETAAEYRPDQRRDLVAWLTPQMFRVWRDVGARGYGRDGLVDRGFRGRNVARNAVYCDLMVRTGLRLQEQSSLTVYDVPERDGFRGYYRSWLPAAIAKYGSARSVYTPDGVLRDLWTYIEVDRAEAVDAARRAGRYERIADALVVEAPARASVRLGGRLVSVDRLDPAQRRRLLVRTDDGLEPAALWLGEDGMPLGLRAWKTVFRTASDRCRRVGIGVYCHAHLLRHSFAVTTLEHLQRGHLAALGEMNPQQRRHYQMVFGDPLDWIRRRLGHRSVETTSKYLHVLAELEMETRLALVSDAWEDPRLLRASDLTVEGAAVTDEATGAAA
ncbi:hypothetical protein ACIA59_24160 [Micromonospora haikouensis]|uniref:hypothetical protein n=1 Tax=Micromonospora haikouensis TaxID=686309 RepID=UPI0037BA22AE